MTMGYDQMPRPHAPILVLQNFGLREFLIHHTSNSSELRSGEVLNWHEGINGPYSPSRSTTLNDFRASRLRRNLKHLLAKPPEY
jgi:hypothetical protein